MQPLRIFVSHSFSDAHHRGGLESFRNAIARVVNEAQRHLAYGVRVDVQFAIDRYGEALFEEVLNEIRAADIVIVDLNGLRLNVVLEAGVRLGIGAPLMTIADKSAWNPADLPSELVHLVIGLYDGPDDILRLLEVRLREQFESLLRDVARSDVRDIWFGKEADEINVVCTPEPERSDFASRDNPNYLFVDNLEDRDALLEVAILTSRMYPKATLTRHVSSGVTADVLKRNIIVIGGPGFDDDQGNVIASELIHSRGLGIRYGSENGEFLEFRGRRFSPTIRSSGKVERDYGYFARFRNPLNSESFAVVAHGVYTAGTLGACVAFSDSPDAAANHRWLREKLDINARSEFEVLVQVDVGPGGGVTPAGVRPLNVSAL